MGQIETQFTDARQDSMDLLASRAIQLGHDVVAVSGFLDEVNLATQAQQAPMESARLASGDVARANEAVRVATGQLVRAVEETRKAVSASSERIRDNSEHSHGVAEWVRTLDQRMSEIAATLDTMRGVVSGVSEIALQVKILAVTAKIEAARAGAAGRGFSVVADEINPLSQHTSEATEGIQTAIAGLAQGIHGLRDEAEAVSQRAAIALGESASVDAALTEIQSVVDGSRQAALETERKAASVQAAHGRFAPAVDAVLSGASRTAAHLSQAREQVSGLIGLSEQIIQPSVALGGDTADAPMIALVQAGARRLGEALAGAVSRGEITMQGLFDQSYRPIADTNPQQMLAPYTLLTDRLFPPVQEEMLTRDPRIVFCAAVDRNGYLPTHNRKFAAPQSADPVWNAAHCRNRRLFDDRVGLGAGRNTEAFLMQVYRRDMGGGNFMMMKDLSAPITVGGRHWGGLRLAYRF